VLASRLNKLANSSIEIFVNLCEKMAINVLDFETIFRIWLLKISDFSTFIVWQTISIIAFKSNFFD